MLSCGLFQPCEDAFKKGSVLAYSAATLAFLALGVGCYFAAEAINPSDGPGYQALSVLSWMGVLASACATPIFLSVAVSTGIENCRESSAESSRLIYN